MVVKRRSRNARRTRNTRNTRNTKRTIKRVRKKKYSRKKKTGGAEHYVPAHVQDAVAAAKAHEHGREPGGSTVYGMNYEEFKELPEEVRQKILKTKGKDGNIFQSLERDEFKGTPKEVRQNMIKTHHDEYNARAQGGTANPFNMLDNN